MSAIDWLQRLLIGDAAWLFLVEVIYRAAIIYLVLLVAMRAMGKRQAAQLGITELAIVLMLGASISAPVQMPTQGVLPAVVVLATIASLQRGVSWWSYRSERIEFLSHGDAITMVEDGVLALDQLEKTKISREMLMSELRARGVLELGELERVYLEVSGSLSIFRCAQPHPGLSLSPSSREGAWPVRPLDDKQSCAYCGSPWHAADEGGCTQCGHRHPVAACLPG
jgi:uncharacterized membrane protein YcaP (DUF421 family)